MTDPIVIVGSSLAGLRSAEQLRAQGWEGAITLIGDEERLPYNRPPLSKQALAGARKLSLADLHGTVALGLKPRLGEIDWRLGKRAVASDLENREITLDDGERIAYSGLVIATGLRPRCLPLAGGEAQRYRIRNLDDAWRLGQALNEGCRVTIAGAGFIGCELAATASRMGCRVSVVDATDAPLVNVVGARFAAALLRYHQAQGVAFHPGTRVAGIESDRQGHLRGVVLASGAMLETDVLVEAIGSHPNTEWLADNDIDVADGVLCHSDLSLPGHPEAIAVGDVARFANPLFDDVSRRIEHWNIAIETAKKGAVTLLDNLGETPRTAREDTRPVVPSFWSDQFDIKIQGLGMPGLADRIVALEGTLDHGVAAGRLLAMGYYREERLTGIVCVNGEKHQPRYREWLLESLEIGEAGTI